MQRGSGLRQAIAPRILIVDTGGTMRRRVQQWGNSLAVRIPKAFAIEVGLSRNAEVDLEIVCGELHLTPVRPRELSLESLVNGITPENRHDEVAFEGPLGSEAW